MKKTLSMLSHGVVAGLLMLGGFSAAGQSLLSKNKTVTASSFQTGFPGSNAVDDNTTTEWESSASGFNQWLYVDLAGTYDISRVAITWADGAYATTFDIMGSNDAATWTTLKTLDPYTTGASADVVGLHGSYRYIKFNGRGRANSALGYHIAEIKVYGSTPTTAAQQLDLNTITARLKAQYAAVDPMDMTGAMNSVDVNGHWDSLDKATFPYYNYSLHTSRVKRMAEAYSHVGNVSYHSATMKYKLRLAMEYIVKHRPQSSNFYDTVVACPLNYMIAGILMKGVYPADSTFYLSSYLIDNSQNAASQGKNRTWAAQPVLFKGCIEDRYPFTNIGFAAIGKTMDVVTGLEDEGIKIDNSTHQHHNQQYTGGYGQSMLDDQVMYQRLARSTSFFTTNFTSTRQTNLINALLKGVQPISYKNNVDFGTAGRDIARPGLTAFKPATLDTMKLNDPAHTTDYDNWKTNIAGGSFGSGYLGMNYFWKSAQFTAHGANYYMSAKIIRYKTWGTERLNNENIKGYNLPMGATNIMVTGNEYYHIFPLWNWSKVPGTTAQLVDTATIIPDGKYVVGNNAFGGGVSHIDDGAIAYDHNYKGVQAKKAYFFMNDMMLCLGAGITASKPNEIVTTIDQLKLNGTVTVNNSSGTSTLGTDSLSSTSFNWINHNNTGYLMLQTGSMSVTTRSRTGNWHFINGGGSTADSSANIFTLWYKHTATPSNATYAYLVVPNKTAADMPTLASGHGFVIDANTSSLQAIHNSVQNKYAIVFYTAGTASFSDGLIITSASAAIVFVKKYSSNYRISIGDPLYSQANITLTINKNVSGTGSAYNATTGKTTIVATMPGGDLQGSEFYDFYDIVAAKMAASSNETALASPLETNDGIVSIYPNPASTTINVKGLKSAADIDVYNLAGRRYKTVHGVSVDVSELPAGVTYFLRIHVDGKIISKQFVKN